MNPHRREIFRKTPGSLDDRPVISAQIIVKRDAERRYRSAGSTTVKIVPPEGGNSI